VLFRSIIQLKGATKPTWNKAKTHLSYQIESKRLAEHIKKREPVFLVVVDVINKKGYYLFLQKYIDDLLTEKWRNRITPTVKVPSCNCIDDLSTFKNDIIKAYDYLAAKHPATIGLSIHAKKNRLQSLDHRFVPNINVIDGNTYVNFSAISDVKMKIHFNHESSDVLKQKAIDLIEKGHEVVFEAGEITVEGHLYSRN